MEASGGAKREALRRLRAGGDGHGVRAVRGRHQRSARPRSGRCSPRGTTPRCSGSDATSTRERPGPSGAARTGVEGTQAPAPGASRGGRGPFVRFRHPVRRRDGRGGVRPRGRESALGSRGVAPGARTSAAARSDFAGGVPGAEGATGTSPTSPWRFWSGRGNSPAPGGVMAMLVPAKVATAAYGAAARTALSESGTVLAVADLTNMPDASFDATTYPLAIVARSHRPPADHRPRLGLDPASSVALGEIGAGRGTVDPGAGHAPGRPWRACAGIPRCPSRTRIQLGVKTGANHLFLAPAAEIEEELVRPAVHGKDLRAFLATPSGRIVWTHDARGAGAPVAPTRGRPPLQASRRRPPRALRRCRRCAVVPLPGLRRAPRAPGDLGGPRPPTGGGMPGRAAVTRVGSA